MRSVLSSLVLFVLLLTAIGGAQQAVAQQAVTFTCLAPAGHVCQIGVRSGGGQLNFALPSGEKKEMAGITPHTDKYCICDPGPVTPDCKQPRLDLWCFGSWQEVQPGVNSENDGVKHLFAIGGPKQAD